MNKSKNILISGAEGLPVALDICYPEQDQQPVIIYAHGFNGFKDWASFDLIAEQFATTGFCFIKFNFSHNGTAPEAPEELVNLEAFGQNNYTKELYDLQAVIDWALDDNNPYSPAMDKNNLFLLGHSRGGGVVLLKAAEEPRIKAVATWASVAEAKTPWGSWSPDRIEQWKQSGAEHYTNSRTGQQMPLYYQLYEDYQANQKRLDILKAAEGLSVPILICHGTLDEAVPVEKARQLKAAAKNAELYLVESDHVFGRKHPWPHSHLPQPMQDVVNKTISFFNKVADKDQGPGK
jgi:uncharacterized protein